MGEVDIVLERRVQERANPIAEIMHAFDGLAKELVVVVCRRFRVDHP